MQEYKQRIVSEKKELDQKIGRLAAFLDGETAATVSVEEIERMKRQFEIMKEYSQILAERIAAF